MKQTLSLERFRSLLSAYGARFELWPDAEGARARALCEASPEARALVAAELELDARFAAASAAPEPSPDFMRRLNEVPLRAPQRRVFWPFRSLWVPALGWALAAVVGLGWGLEAAPFDLGEVDAATVAAVDSAAPDTADTDAPSPDDELAALAGGTLVDFQE